MEQPRMPEVNNQLFEIAITAFVMKDGKFLIIQRSPDKKRFPSRWTIPGGRLEVSDFIDTPKETAEYWYNVAEKVVARETREETGLEVSTAGMRYVTSLATVHEDGAPSFVLSFIVDYQSGEVVLQEDECVDHAWITLEEGKDYDLIDGIYDEMVMADKVLRGESSEWQRF